VGSARRGVGRPRPPHPPARARPAPPAAGAPAAARAAAALGSTLFEAPPKDAAEFAARVAAGSERANRNDSKGKTTGRKRSADERRFVRQLNAMCSRQERELDRLPTPRTIEETLDFLRRALVIGSRHHEEARRLHPPKRFRDEFAQLLALDESGFAALEAMRSALARHDQPAYEAALAKVNALSARGDRIVRRVGATACLSD
jgi:hypothetical protein